VHHHPRTETHPDSAVSLDAGQSREAAQEFSPRRKPREEQQRTRQAPWERQKTSQESGSAFHKKRI